MAPHRVLPALGLPALPSLPPPIPAPSLGTPLPTPGRCLPPPALSQPLPLRFSLAGPRRKVDVRCVHAPGAAGWVGALHWWGWGCMRFHLHPLWLPRLPSSHPGVGPDPDLHPQAENGEGAPLTPVTPRHTSSPSTSCSLSCPPSASCMQGQRWAQGGLGGEGHVLLGPECSGTGPSAGPVAGGGRGWGQLGL